MKCFQNILLVAGSNDGPISGNVVERVAGLAKTNGAKLTLIDVIRESDFFREILPPALLETIRKDRLQSLTRLRELAHNNGVESEVELVVGRPFVEIIRRVQRNDHDLVVTDGGRNSRSRGVIDNRTMQLMRKCPCEIWVARQSGRGRYSRILAAIDPLATDAPKDALNRKIMGLAISVAEAERAELHVVQVLESFGAPQAASPEVWREWESTARSEMAKGLRLLLRDFDLAKDPEIHSITGRPAGGISQIATGESIDLLVMGTIRRTGVRGFFIGHTAEEVLGRVSCSLLAVKPDGFVSPV
jgi:nucleotide-binding universal stress UspA family protein